MKRYIVLLLLLSGCQNGSPQASEATESQSALVFQVDKTPPSVDAPANEDVIIGRGGSYGGRPEGQLAWLVHMCSGARNVQMRSWMHTGTQIAIPTRAAFVAQGANEEGVADNASIVQCVQQRFSGNFVAGLGSMANNEYLEIDREPFACLYGE